MRSVFVFAFAVAIAATASAQTNVVVGIGQPDYFGRIDIGNYPPPVLIYAQPVLVAPVTPGLVREPIYLHVPAEHARNWRQHCHWYAACGRPVYFVQDVWYQQVYVPRYRQMYDRDHGHRAWGDHDHPGGHGPWPGRGRHGDGWNN